MYIIANFRAGVIFLKDDGFGLYGVPILVCSYDLRGKWVRCKNGSEPLSWGDVWVSKNIFDPMESRWVIFSRSCEVAARPRATTKPFQRVFPFMILGVVWLCFTSFFLVRVGRFFSHKIVIFWKWEISLSFFFN